MRNSVHTFKMIYAAFSQFSVELGALITKVISVIQKAAAGNQFTMPISGVLAGLSADIAKLKSDNESTGSGLRI